MYPDASNTCKRRKLTNQSESRMSAATTFYQTEKERYQQLLEQHLHAYGKDKERRGPRFSPYSKKMSSQGRNPSNKPSSYNEFCASSFFSMNFMSKKKDDTLSVYQDAISHLNQSTRVKSSASFEKPQEVIDLASPQAPTPPDRLTNPKAKKLWLLAHQRKNDMRVQEGQSGLLGLCLQSSCFATPVQSPSSNIDYNQTVTPVVHHQPASRRVSFTELPSLNVKIPETSQKFKEESQKFNNQTRSNTWKNLGKLDSKSKTSLDLDHLTARVSQISVERKKTSEEIKKSFRSSQDLRPQFYPEFVPPIRQFKVEEKEEEDEEKDVFKFEPTLEVIEQFIEERLASVTRDSDVLIEKDNLTITPKDLDTLEGLNWLNDEVINFYFNLIQERSRLLDNLPKVYVFNTFFFSKLRSGPNAFNMLKRWTRKVDIFSFDYVLIPLHLGVHWTLCSINCKKRRITYYDSMGGGRINGKGSSFQQEILHYLQKEHQDKKGTTLPSDWSICAEGYDEDGRGNQVIPQQGNGSDCGVFTCHFAEFISRRAPFVFGQEEMPYLRRRMAYEILKGQLVN